MAATDGPARREPFREAWHVTATRTVGLAVAIGLAAGIVRRQLSAAPLVALLALWFTLGGHFLELLLRDGLLPRMTRTPAVQIAARLAGWFVGGSALYAAAATSGALLTGRREVPWHWWWVAGLGFVGAELLIHALLRLRRQPNCYDGTG